MLACGLVELQWLGRPYADVHFVLLVRIHDGGGGVGMLGGALAVRGVASEVRLRCGGELAGSGNACFCLQCSPVAFVLQWRMR